MSLVYSLGGAYNTPLSRAIVAGVAAGALLWVAKPSIVFLPSGRPRRPIWVARLDQRGEATYMPWWAVVLGVVVAVDLFV